MWRTVRPYKKNESVYTGHVSTRYPRSNVYNTPPSYHWEWYDVLANPGFRTSSVLKIPGTHPLTQASRAIGHTGCPRDHVDFESLTGIHVYK